MPNLCLLTQILANNHTNKHRICQRYAKIGWFSLIIAYIWAKFSYFVWKLVKIVESFVKYCVSLLKV